MSFVSYQQLLTMLNEGEPFSLARFNDGEASAILGKSTIVARGDQYIDHTLRMKLHAAILAENKNYIIGLPCRICYPVLRSGLDNMIKHTNRRTTSAVIFTNRNWNSFINLFPILIKNKPVYWVSGSDQKLSNLNFPIVDAIFFDRINSWQYYDQLRSCPNFPDGSIVCISCGPLARVLAAEWFAQKPNVTFLDIGSIWDPFTRNVRHSCHNGTLKPCLECN